MVGSHRTVSGPSAERPRYPEPVSTELRLDPELAAVVDAARRRAERLGELSRPPARPYVSPLGPEVADAVHRWLHDGGYAAALAQVVAEDPDLANE
jgi:hypothetical protein